MRLFFSSWIKNCLFFTIHRKEKNPWAQNSHIFLPPSLQMHLHPLPPPSSYNRSSGPSPSRGQSWPHHHPRGPCSGTSMLSATPSCLCSFHLSLCHGSRLVVFKHVLASLILKQHPYPQTLHSSLAKSLSLIPSRRTKSLKNYLHLHPLLNLFQSGFSHQISTKMLLTRTLAGQSDLTNTPWSTFSPWPPYLHNVPRFSPGFSSGCSFSIPFLSKSFSIHPLSFGVLQVSVLSPLPLSPVYNVS